MNKNLKKAKELLYAEDYTCVLCKDDEVYTSFFRGVKPLANWYYNGECFAGFSAADKVIGKATAYLYVLLQVTAVYTKVISKPALEVFSKHQIPVKYDILSDTIINRTGDGVCPFELAVKDVQDPQTAYPIILKKMEEMNISIC